MIALALLTASLPQRPLAVPDLPSLLADAIVTDRATLRWPGTVRLSVDPGNDETVVRFDRPPTDAAIESFRRAAGDAVARLDWNDTSLVLRPAPGRILTATPRGDMLVVTIVFAAAPDDVAPAGAVEDPVPYALAAAQADAAAGYPGRARRRLAALPADDVRVERAVADSDAARGASGRAAGVYRDLGADDPAARATLRDAGGEASLATTYRDGAGFSQADAAARLSLPVSPAATAALTLRHVRTRADAVVGRGGLTRPARTNATLAEVGGAFVGTGPVRVEVAMVADLSDPRVSLRGRLFHGWAEGEARLVLAYRVPEYATAEQAVFGGYASRIGGGFTARVSPALQARVDIGRNRYGLDGESRLVDSTTLSGGLDLILHRGSPDILLLYRLDAEYVGRQVLRPGGLPALAYFDRENHTGQLLVARDVGAVRLAAAGGWTFDRYGSDGPTATVSAQGAFGDGWRFDVGGGVTSIQQPNLPGTQLFARAAIAKSLGRP